MFYKLVDFAWTGGLGIACIVQLLCAVILLYVYIGWPGFVGKRKKEKERERKGSDETQ
jgi:hypothetical protein